MTREKNRMEYIWYFLLTVVSIGVVFAAYNLWNWNLKIPMEYGGDSLGALTLIKNFTQGGWYNFDNVAAPYGCFKYDYYADGFINWVVLKGMSYIISDVGMIVNLFYLASFSLVSISAFYVMRRQNVSCPVAFVISLLYSILPYHFRRGVSHLFLGAYFAVPLACLSIIYSMEGELCKNEYKLKERLSFKQLFLSAFNEKMYFSIFVCVLTAATSIYYGVFFCIILCFSVLYCSISKRQWRHIFYGGIDFFFTGIVFILCYLPGLINRSDTLSYSLASRGVGDVDIYGMKLAHLLLPMQGHRIPIFSKLKLVYDSYFGHNNENAWSSLGLVISVGFIITILLIFFGNALKQDKLHEQLKKLGLINLYIFFIATVGGISVFISIFISHSIRCYNRMSVFIAMFSALAIAKILDSIKFKWKISKMAFLVILLFLGVLDQTNFAISKEYSELAELDYNQDKEFVDNIEKLEGESAMIAELPILAGTTTDILTTGLSGGYELWKPYIHSTSSKWSCYDLIGGKLDNMMLGISKLPIDKVIKIFYCMDFSGISIYSTGYGENWETIKGQIENILGDPTFVNNEWFYYSLANYQGENFDSRENYEISLNSGFFDQENWGNWATNKSSITIYNTSGKEDDVTLEFTAYTGHQAASQLIVTGESLGKQQYTINSDAKSFVLNLKLKPGANDLVFTTDALKVHAPQDPRELYLAFSDWNIY